MRKGAVTDAVLMIHDNYPVKTTIFHNQSCYNGALLTDEAGFSFA